VIDAKQGRSDDQHRAALGTTTDESDACQSFPEYFLRSYA
jgi:hypothetical protein